jgi:hypothetical protein
MSIRLTIFTVILTLLPTVVSAQEISALIKLKVAVDKAHEAPREQATLKTLYDARHKFTEERTHADMLAAVALGLRLQGQKEASERVAAELKKAFPKAGANRHLESKKLLGHCPTCEGTTKAPVDCRECKGTGKCQNSKCKGGYITVLGLDKNKTKRCPSCKGGHCGECQGRGKLKQDCLRCRKTGRIVTKERIQKVYQDVLRDVGRSIGRQMEEIAHRERRAAERAQANAPKPPPSTSPAPDEDDDADPFANITLEEGDSEYDAVFADHRTSPEVEVIAKNMAMWINSQQREMKAQPVRRVYAVLDGEKVTLNVETGDDFTAQSASWRTRFLKDCSDYWAKRCRKNSTGGKLEGVVKYLASDGRPLTVADPQN